MNAIAEIVNIMTREEKKEFIAYLSRRNKRGDVGNIRLFKLIETDDIEAKNSFGSKDAYHALRKRLYDNLVDFMANRSFEKDTSEEQGVLRLLVVGRAFFEHKLYKTGFRCLAKAEDKAIRLSQFSLLNEIYQAQIQFLHLDASIPLADIINKYNANKIRLEQEERLNIAYALVRRELAEIYYKGKIINFTSFIKNTIKSQNISLRHAITFRSLYQILYIANEYASINSNYTIIEPFIIRGYHFIAAREHQAERHLYYHIHILYFIANTHFRNRKFKEAEGYLITMHQEMEKQDRRYYHRFALRYNLLLALVLNYTGKPETAIQTAKNALQSTKYDLTDMNDLRLALSVFYIQHGNARDAHRYFKVFVHTDSWYEKKTGMDWAIKKNLVELILHAELENTEFLLARARSFKRRYKQYLLQVGEGRVLSYIQVIERFASKPEAIASEAFKNSILDLQKTGYKVPEDIFVVSFIGWLLAKANKKPVYETTLNLLNHFSPPHSA